MTLKGLIDWGYAVCDAALRMHVDPALNAPAGLRVPRSDRPSQSRLRAWTVTAICSNPTITSRRWTPSRARCSSRAAGGFRALEPPARFLVETGSVGDERAPWSAGGLRVADDPVADASAVEGRADTCQEIEELQLARVRAIVRCASGTRAGRAIIAADVRRFAHVINTDGVIGTHNGGGGRARSMRVQMRRG
jgi:hypothetical protein